MQALACKRARAKSLTPARFNLLAELRSFASQEYEALTFLYNLAIIAFNTSVIILLIYKQLEALGNSS